MSAPTGNNNAEKWTLAKTEALISQIEKHTTDSKYIFLSQALLAERCYTEIWSRLKKKWKDNIEIIDRMCLIEQYFQDVIIEGAMNGTFSASMSICMLRQNYKMMEVHDDIKKQERQEAKARRAVEEWVKENKQSK